MKEVSVYEQYKYSRWLNEGCYCTTVLFTLDGLLWYG